MLSEPVKQIEFHSFLVVDGRVIGHYRKEYRVGDPLGIPPSFWYDPEYDFEGENPADVVGGAMIINGSEISESHAVASPGDVPGVLVPSPGSPEWNLMPLNEGIPMAEDVSDYQRAVEEVHGR